MSGSESRFAVRFEGLTLLGRYAVGERLGAGGMATVYQGTDTQLDVPVVVKVPHVALLAEPGFRARFQKEIQDLILLRHPHVVQILARGEHAEVPFLVQQFLEGGSLEDRLQGAPGRRLAGGDVAQWLPDAAKALDYMHARGIVHRDVKPANVLFDEHGYVYLSDFGIAKAIGASDTGLTMTGTTPGSPTYMAPEQARGEEVTGAADQYALASTVFEALVGRAPFEGRSVIDVLLKKQSEAAPRARALHEGVPPGVDEVLARALDRDPAARFPSCSAFATAHGEALRAAPAPTASPAAVAEPAPVPERGPTDLGAGPPVAEQALAVPVPTETRSAPPPPEAQAPLRPGRTRTFVVGAPGTTPPRRRTMRFAFQVSTALVLVALGTGWYLLHGAGGGGDRRPAKPEMRAPPPRGPDPGSQVPAAPEEAFVGTWGPDWEGLRRLLEAGGPEARGFDEDMLETRGQVDMTLTLWQDGTWRVAYSRRRPTGVETRAISGRWTLSDARRAELEVQLVDGRPPPPDAVLQLVGTLRGTGLVLDADGEKMLLRRAR